jgi:hypothetical protein
MTPRPFDPEHRPWLLSTAAVISIITTTAVVVWVGSKVVDRLDRMERTQWSVYEQKDFADNLRWNNTGLARKDGTDGLFVPAVNVHRNE